MNAAKGEVGSSQSKMVELVKENCAGGWCADHIEDTAHEGQWAKLPTYMDTNGIPNVVFSASETCMEWRETTCLMQVLM